MFKTGSVLLFQGDSITDGGRNPIDRNHDLGHSYVYLLAARLGYDYPERRLQIINRGISGNRVVNLYARWREDCINISPDLVSILIGVNDTIGEYSHQNGIPAPKYEMVYSLMLEELLETNANVKIVLCEPFMLQVGIADRLPKGWKEELIRKQEAVRHLAKKFNAVFVPLQKIFDDALCHAVPEYWLWDGVHPTSAGHELIARQWLKCVEAAK